MGDDGKLSFFRGVKSRGPRIVKHFLWPVVDSARINGRKMYVKIVNSKTN